MSAEDNEYMGDKEFPTKESALDWLDNYLSLNERNNLIRALGQEPKTGHWIDADGDNAICSCCNRLNHLYGTYCKHCGAKMLPTGSNCDSCKYHNEVDGSNCYECVKGICNNYKADSEMATEEAIAFFKDMNECTYDNLKPIQMAMEALELEYKTREILNKDCNDISKFIFIKELYENKRESEEEL